MVTFFRFAHLLNAYLPILLTEEGIDIFSKEKQSRKHSLPIDLTEEGIFKDVNDEQLLKHPSSINLTEEGIVI